MLQEGLLNHNDFLHLSRLTHSILRGPKNSKEKKQLAVTFLYQLIGDLQAGKIFPHHQGIMHLISMLKERGDYDGGIQLWTWLSNKSGDYVSPYVYGAAIELFTLHSLHTGTGAKLSDLENMYAEALKRFPGDFAQYHLQPNAILPDRRELVEMKGLHITLLEGITYARLMLGEWKSAYLALDTALRLLPTQAPLRLYEMFIFNRPLAETYRVFMIACRSGIEIRSDLLTIMLCKLTDSMKKSGTELKLNSIGAMLNAIEAYTSGGYKLSPPHLSQLIKGFESVLTKVPLKAVPRMEFKEGLSQQKLPENELGDKVQNAEPSTESQERPPPGRFNRNIAEIAREVIMNFHASGVPASDSSFATLIGLAGRARSAEILGLSILDLQSSGVEQTDILRRIMVLAAGQIGHQSLLETTWKSIVEARMAEGVTFDWLDWMALSRAARYENRFAFVEEQLEKYKEITPYGVPEKIKLEFEKKGATIIMPTEAEEKMLETRLPELRAQALRIAAQIKEPRLRNLYEEPLPKLQAPVSSPIPEDMLRTIYDELTKDPRQPEKPEPVRVAVSPSGYPVDELRFANWKTINECIMDAAYAEERRNRLRHLLDTAPASERYGVRLKRLIEPHLDPRRVPKLTEKEPAVEEVTYTLESAREEIRKMRDVDWSLEAGSGIGF
ncbi:uncharacterized protein K452DRAFT_282489 [Aplosporella prunicola CBS 121167]|uniref:Uncharacterized protein n=1 Tax=Aplosporella prunicola CBS 121167 TaxID=1176127 RepID=A0A6A6BXA9_9PEZI|nr:uncharacterized protein K452DRAFT_282489 [Aplosporella prunicola CBS 121167]KAF2147484.1 hypothetical protein K452DRAFT_282489 [Aplosporella prunicola CBS 121167]